MSNLRYHSASLKAPLLTGAFQLPPSGARLRERASWKQSFRLFRLSLLACGALYDALLGALCYGLTRFAECCQAFEELSKEPFLTPWKARLGAGMGLAHL